MTDSAESAALFADLHRHGRFVRAVARGLVGAADADDVEQEAWLTVLRHPPEPGRGIRAWLGTVARNAALKLLRGEGRRRIREESSARPEVMLPSSVLTEREGKIAAVLQAIGGLDETSRQVVHWRFYDGLSVAEIATRIGSTPGAVRTRLSRALDRVRGDLDVRAGGREAWTAVLLPLAFPGMAAKAAAVTGAAAAGGIAAKATVGAGVSAGIGSGAAAAAVWLDFGGLFVAKKLMIAALVLAAAAVSVVMLRNDEADRGGNDRVVPARAGEGPAAAPPVAERTNEVAKIASSPFNPERDRFDDDGAAAPAPLRPVRVIGRVVDEQGAAIAGAAVRLRADSDFGPVRAGSTPPAEITTDAEGRFTLDAPAGGEATVRARPTELADAVRRCKLPQDGTLDLGDLVAKKGASVEGFVRDEQGRAIPGATVVGNTNDSGSMFFVRTGDDADRSTTTDAAGRYGLRGLSTGEGRIEAWSDDRPAAVKGGLAFGAGASLRGVDLVLVDGRSIEGVVRDARGEPVAQARVRASRAMRMMGGDGPTPPEVDRRTVTDDRGRFTLRGLSEETFTVAARKTGFVGANKPATPGTEPVALTLKAAGGVFGRVTGPDGKPAPSVNVSVRRDGFGMLFSRDGAGGPKVVYGAEAAALLGESGAEGWWFAPEVPYETATLVVTSPGAVMAERTGVPTPAGERTRLDIALERERVVNGTVVDSAGKAVAGAAVTVRTKSAPGEESAEGGMRFRTAVAATSPGGSGIRMMQPGEEVGRATTGADGAFAVRSLPDGDYEVTAEARGHLPSPAAPAAVTAANPEASVALALGLAGAIGGRAFDAEGTPAVGARINARSSKRASDVIVFGDSGGNASDLTDRDGKFLLQGLAPGKYIVAMAAPRGEGGGAMFMFGGAEEEAPKLKPGEKLVEVEAGKTAEVDLTEPKPAVLSGYVTEAGKAAAGVLVRLGADFGGGMMLLGGGPTVVTDDRGFYSFPPRSAGKYRLSVEPEGAPDPISKSVELLEGKASREDVALPTGSIEGRITDDEGAPVVGARIEASRMTGSNEAASTSVGYSVAIGGLASDEDADGGVSMVRSFGAKLKHITSDADGRFTLRYLAAGSYAVSATHDAFAKAEISDVVVAESAATRGVALKTSAAGSIEVTVDFGAAGEQGFAMLEFVPAEGPPTHSSVGGDGLTRQHGLKPGRWTVRATLPGGDKPQERTVDVRAGSVAKASFRF